jgi:hypothetical protein
MTGLRCGLVVINHVHRGLVIDVENGRPYFLKTKFLKDVALVLDDLVKNSASVDKVATVACILDLYATHPPS